MTAPRGFRAAAVCAGLLGRGMLDLAVLVNDGPGRAAAGVFTRSRLPAAPVQWTRQVLTTGQLSAVVLNSGGANACTGPDGFQTTHATAESAAARLDRGAIEVAVCSTGPIGAPLPRAAVLAGVTAATAALSDSDSAGTDAAVVVSDTPTRTRVSLREDAKGWMVGGLASAPDDAGLVALLTTDAQATADDLRAVLAEAYARTFTHPGRVPAPSDTVLVMASGASGELAGRAELADAVSSVCAELADPPPVAGSAEGGEGPVTVSVHAAASGADARELARVVAADPLARSGLVLGGWGRVAVLIGASATPVDPDRLEIVVNDVPVCVNGVSTGRTPPTRRETAVRIRLNMGAGEAAAGHDTGGVAVAIDGQGDR